MFETLANGVAVKGCKRFEQTTSSGYSAVMRTAHKAISHHPVKMGFILEDIFYGLLEKTGNFEGQR